MATYDISYNRIRFENWANNREPILNENEEEIGWYIKPTLNVTIKDEDGNLKGLAIQFLRDGELRINGRLIPSGHDITNPQLAELKTMAKFLWSKTRSLLNNLIEEQDMT